MQKPDYSYFVDKSEKGFKCQLKYIDENQIVQLRLDRRCVTRLVEIIMKSLPLEQGVLSLRCELRGTNCEAHISLMSNQDTVDVINKLGKDGLTHELESVKAAKFFPERINLYERREVGGSPKDYLLGVDGRLQENLRARLGLKPYSKGHCHGGIVHTTHIKAFMETVRKN